MKPLESRPTAALRNLFRSLREGAADKRAKPERTTTPEPRSQQGRDNLLSLCEIFRIFCRAGLAFGGGVGIMAALEEELVHKRQLVSQTDYLAAYALARFVPTGTMTAMAIAYGYRFAGWLGSVVAMIALVLPSTLLALLLTIAHEALPNGQVLTMIPAVVLPAALAFIVASAVKLGKEVSRSNVGLAIAVASFLAVWLIGVHPFVIMLAGGLVGLLRGQPSPSTSTQK